MMKSIHKLLDQFQSNFKISYSRNEDGVELVIDGIGETLQIGFSGDEIILFGDTWHEHFEGPDDLKDFLGKLFVGKIQLVTKYRGNTPVAHQLQMISDGMPDVISQTGTIFSPFWRKKYFKTQTYIAANKRLE